MKNNIYEDLAAIGLRVGSVSNGKISPVYIDIERTLVEALYKSEEDSKIPSLVISWAKIHNDHIIVEKFAKISSEFEKILGTSVWINIFNLFCFYEFKNSRFKKLIKKEDESYFHLGREIAVSGIKLKGEYKFLSDHNIFVSKSFFRIREDDVLDCKSLIQSNHQYKNRFIYGACWRADIIYLIQKGVSNPAQISKQIGCSYEPAYRVFKEYQMAIGA